MPDRNLRSRFLGTHHLALVRSGRRHPPRRILRGGRCQRRARSPFRGSRRRRPRPSAVGALRRRSSTKIPHQTGVPHFSRVFGARSGGTRSGGFFSSRVRLRPYPFAAVLATLGTSPARHRSASRKRRLRIDRPRSRRHATTCRTPDSLDHMVPLPPRDRTHTHDPAYDRATSHRRKLFLPAAAVGTRK